MKKGGGGKADESRTFLIIQTNSPSLLKTCVSFPFSSSSSNVRRSGLCMFVVGMSEFSLIEGEKRERA
jgi:hypothetical protein